jgi:hypothetical protein
MEMSGHLQPPKKRVHGTHWIGGWVAPTAGPDAVTSKINNNNNNNNIKCSYVNIYLCAKKSSQINAAVLLPVSYNAMHDYSIYLGIQPDESI